MPFQSKRISLSALGIESVPGMVTGKHLRIGFDPRMGFPPCGFLVYRREHRTGARRQLDFARLFTEMIRALFRNGYSQDGVSVFHPRAPLPTQSPEGGVELTNQRLAISFRSTPFMPDSNPKVCEVRLRVRSPAGAVTVQGFDDRYDNDGFQRILVAHQEKRFDAPPFDPGLFDNSLTTLHRGWTRFFNRVIGSLLGNQPNAPAPITENLRPPTRQDLDAISKANPRLANDPQFKELRRRILGEFDGSAADPGQPPITSPGSEGAPRDRPLVRRLMRFNKFLSDTLFSRSVLTAGSVTDFHLRADLISLVEIRAPAGARLLSFEYTLVHERGWERVINPADAPWGFFKEMPLLLPTPQFVDPTHSTYPTCTSLVFPRPAEQIERELPPRRLTAGFVEKTSNDDVHGEYDLLEKYLDVYLGPEPQRLRFKELNESMRAIEAVQPAQQLALTVTNPGDTDESSTFAPLPMILTGTVDYPFARLAGLAMIDIGQTPDKPDDYMVEAKWNDVSHFWITHNVFRGRDKLLNPPQAATAIPILDVTRPGDVKTNVQLDWLAPSGLALLDRANQYAGYHVFRRHVDPLEMQLRLTESSDELTGITTPDLLLLGEVQGDEPTPPPPEDAGHYLDQPPAYSTFQYGLQAQDLFGRRSEITWGDKVVVPVLVDPPPVSDLFAFYLDSNDPGQAELDPHAAEILDATGELAFSGTALLISFRYPQASIEAIAGDVASFNVAYRHGRQNELLGTLATPVIVGPIPQQATAPVLADTELTTVTPVAVGIDGFGGERSRGALASDAEFFAIESAARLGANLVRLRVRARRDYLPQVGEASLSIGRGGPGVSPHPIFVSPRDPAAWSGFDLRHPSESSDQGPIILSADDESVLSPLPVAVNANQIVVSRTVEPPANLEAGEPATPSDWVYRIVVKNIELPLPTGLTQYPGALTVQVVSVANRRSELPAPAYVLRRAYGPPPPLTELASSEFVTASRPDFQGRIGVNLSWPRIAGVQQFNVYRIDVPKLLQERGADLQLAEDLFEVEANRAEVKLLGGQLESVTSFTLITPIAIQPEIDPQAPGRHTWVDRISAPREQNYVYRVQPLSILGEEAPWPADSPVDNENRDRCILVLQKNRDLLLPPAIYELEPLDRSIGVIVRHPLSSTVTALRIYKTDQPSLVADVRAMTLIHGTIPFTHDRIESLPANNGTPARLKFVDGKVQVGVQYYYRIVLVDEFGNFSQASEPMGVTPRSFSPPRPPTLSAERTATDTVALSWEADHNEGQVKVQRKHSGDSQWADVTAGWLLPTDTVIDVDAAGIVAHRLLLRDAKGRLVYSEPLITEA